MASIEEQIGKIAEFFDVDASGALEVVDRCDVGKKLLVFPSVFALSNIECGTTGFSNAYQKSLPVFLNRLKQSTSPKFLFDASLEEAVSTAVMAEAFDAFNEGNDIVVLFVSISSALKIPFRFWPEAWPMSFDATCFVLGTLQVASAIVAGFDFGNFSGVLCPGDIVEDKMPLFEFDKALGRSVVRVSLIPREISMKELQRLCFLNGRIVL